MKTDDGLIKQNHEHKKLQNFQVKSIIRAKLSSPVKLTIANDQRKRNISALPATAE